MMVPQHKLEIWPVKLLLLDALLQEMSRLLVLLALLVVFLPNAHSASLPISAELAEDGVLELDIDLAGIFQPPKMVKRGIDFGLGRGFSGSQAARHMMGLQQASFAGGPGKK